MRHTYNLNSLTNYGPACTTRYLKNKLPIGTEVTLGSPFDAATQRGHIVGYDAYEVGSDKFGRETIDEVYQVEVEGKIILAWAHNLC